MATNAIKKKKKQVFTAINITPLTDIFLVLLIIMMVVAPSFQSFDNNIKAPEINSGVAVEQQTTTVAITSSGQMFLNGEVVNNEEELSSKLTQLSASLTKKEIVVRADEKTKSSEIMKVMRAAQNARYEKLVVAGEPLSSKEQKKLTEENTQERNEVGDIPTD